MKVLKTIGRYLVDKTWQQAIAVREVIPTVARLVKKPVLLGYTLLTAHKAQLFLAAAVLAITLAIAPAVDSGLQSAFPAKSSKKLFGLIKEKKPNRTRETAYARIMLILWVLAGGQTLLFILLHIPKSTARALLRAHKFEIHGDQCLSDNPAESIAAYSRALRLTIDPDYEAQLISKIQVLSTSENSGQFLSPNSENTLVESSTTGRTSIQNNQRPDKPNDWAVPVGSGGRYKIEEELGRGGMGIVYKATDHVLDRTVALKKLPRTLTDDEEYLARFKREAKTLARLTHPAILQIYDLFEDDRDVWMALEYIDGGDMATHLFLYKPLSYTEAARFAQIIAEGMAYAHRQDIVHRDLKPGNILLDRSLQPKISDFGLAKLSLSNSITMEGSILGSPRYMSPEQAAGDDVDQRSDIYSLGIILYEMITGDTPFGGDTAQILTKHITQPPPPPSDIIPELPKDLEDLILHMLAKSIDRRVASMDEVATRLTAWVSTPQTAPSVAQ